MPTTVPIVDRSVVLPEDLPAGPALAGPAVLAGARPRGGLRLVRVVARIGVLVGLVGSLAVVILQPALG